METDPADGTEDPDEPIAPPPAEEDLRVFAGRVLAALDLHAADAAHEHLAEQALWLTVVNMDEWLDAGLVDLLEGRAWAPLFGDREDAPKLTEPQLNRLALGLLLQRRAGEKAPGAAQRTLAALAALALACVDPQAGRRLRRGFGRLELLEVTEQIPVALRVRQLALEYRHMPPSDAPPPPAFVARVEDLLERLDSLGLLQFSLGDLGTRSARDPGEGMLEALVPTRSLALRSLARLLFKGRFETKTSLLDALIAEAPAVWGVTTRDAALGELERRTAELAGLLADGPLALRDDGLGLRSAGATE